MINPRLSWQGGIHARRSPPLMSMFAERCAHRTWILIFFIPRSKLADRAAAPFFSATQACEGTEVVTLWLQDQVDRGLIQVAKIAGQTNSAEVCTKYLDGRGLQEMLSLLPLCFTGGRHVLAPQLRGEIQVLMPHVLAGTLAGAQADVTVSPWLLRVCISSSVSLQIL